MSIDPLLALGLNQTIKLRKRISIDYYGVPQYDAAVEIRCRVSKKFRRIVNGKGDEVVSGAEITTVAAVDEGDEIIIDGQAWPVIAIAVPVTLSGAEHRRKVYI